MLVVSRSACLVAAAAGGGEGGGGGRRGGGRREGVAASAEARQVEEGGGLADLRRSRAVSMAYGARTRMTLIRRCFVGEGKPSGCGGARG